VNFVFHLFRVGQACFDRFTRFLFWPKGAGKVGTVTSAGNFGGTLEVVDGHGTMF